MVLLINLLSTDCKSIHYKASEKCRKMLFWQQNYFSPAKKGKTLLKLSLLRPVSVMSLHLYCAALHFKLIAVCLLWEFNCVINKPATREGDNWAIAYTEIFKNNFNCWVQYLKIILPTPENRKYHLSTDLVTNSMVYCFIWLSNKQKHHKSHRMQ